MLATAELYDPVANTWSTTGRLATARQDHQVTCLNDGRALATGGYNGLTTLSSSEIYDPSTGTWTSGGNMPFASHAHRNVVLPNGKVLVVGGTNPNGAQASAALWNPATQTWSSTGRMFTARAWHAVNLLDNGKVMAAGGFNIFLAATNTTEIYDPSTGLWSAATNLNTARYCVSSANTAFGPMIVGGYNGSGLASAELYSLSRHTWTLLTMPSVSFNQTATALSANQVVVAGGNTGSNGTTAVSLYSGLVTAVPPIQ